MFAGIGSMPADVAPQMIEIDAVGAIASLCEKRAITPQSAASGHGPRSFASFTDAASEPRRRCLNITLFQAFAVADSIATPCDCRKEWKPIRPRPTERSRCAE